MDRKIRSFQDGNPEFKVVGYYPCWVTDSLYKIDYSVVTHVNYAFVIPTREGTLLPMRNPEIARTILTQAHAHGAKVMLVVGGWDYLGELLEETFAAATDTPEKLRNLADEIIALCFQYGFDGVDVDWEFPRLDSPSEKQYEAFMEYLHEQLHGKGKLLTAAVVSGAAAHGGCVKDAAAQTDRVLALCDWINVMAYDGGDSSDHSTYDFAVNCGKYWTEQRGLPGRKVVLGLPFYARPCWASYDRLLASDPEADQKDFTRWEGKEAHYNGIPTIRSKTAYARENLGGVMIWELTQDTDIPEKSLLAAIGAEIG